MFSSTIKSKFVELDDIKKQQFIKKNKKKQTNKRNPLVPSKTTCCICDFLLDVDASGEHKKWHDFIIEREHLFLKNIFSKKDFQKNKKIKTIDEYRFSFERFMQLLPTVEKALSNPKCAEGNEDFENFLRYDLDNLNLEELKDAAHAVEVKKKERKKGKSCYM